ncbi:F-actin-capping protein subunit alpha-like protein [Dinothrombium tinctorium]|uniref:F-actin-capping protein subunit alpha n=1 Tax=Dinothrombium tinctorium TaxID=1965070 RepID=A0A443QUU3_9ACAR|nr:F-actin-capping protein subunit alpha-like protein [Dinothrombium tinctorium]
MAVDQDVALSDQQKVRIVTDFILHAPPGEFKEVLNDVRLLLNNDALLREQASGVFAQYFKDQLTPVKVEGSKYPTLISEYNELSGGRFYDPRSQQCFKYDPLKEETSDYSIWTPDPVSESWRSALECKWTTYCGEHFEKGVPAVFATSQRGSITLIACIEHHQFQPKNFWNGRWRSEWTVTINPEKTNSSSELKGTIKVQVHYYEDGNVQLVSSKEIKESINVMDEDQTTKEIVQKISEAEKEYQVAIADNYLSMSETTFKALRRQLPITKQKIDWNHLMSYKIASELKQH